jgi:hypothetical protein
MNARARRWICFRLHGSKGELHVRQRREMLEDERLHLEHLKAIT